jgi:hypothetical protein
MKTGNGLSRETWETPVFQVAVGDPMVSSGVLPIDKGQHQLNNNWFSTYFEPFRKPR